MSQRPSLAGIVSECRNAIESRNLRESVSRGTDDSLADSAEVAHLIVVSVKPGEVYAGREDSIVAGCVVKVAVPQLSSETNIILARVCQLSRPGSLGATQ